MSLGLKTWLVKEDRLRKENWQKYEVPDNDVDGRGQDDDHPRVAGHQHGDDHPRVAGHEHGDDHPGVTGQDVP